MKLQDGVNKILFRNGKLYLNDIQIGGEGITPQKDILFEFKVNTPEETKKDPSILEINVHDSVAAQALGPGQT